MKNLDLETFVDIYVGAALEIVDGDEPCLDSFYSYVFEKVSRRTGLSEENIKYLHHAFHWTLFLKSYSPFELIDSQSPNGFTRVRLKGNSPKKSELVSCLLREHRTWLEERIKNINYSNISA